MLIIRNAQLQAFRDTILREVQAEALAAWPAAERPCALELEQMIERARRHGLASRSDLTRFLTLARTLGIAFDLAPQHAWVQEVLADGEMSGALKLNVLEEGLLSMGARP